MTIPYIMGRDSITIMHGGVTHTIMNDHVNYVALKEAIREQRWADVPDLVTPVKAMESFVAPSAGEITIQNGEVYYQGAPLHNSVTERILHMIRDGFDAQPLIKFLTKLMSNPSRTAVSELYDWLAGTQLPITQDGDFMAYKKVRADFMDFYTGKVLNKPADLMTDQEKANMPVTEQGVTTEIQDGFTVLHMPRNQVDDNRDRTCSQGLHFCSLSYLPSYHGGQGRVLLVRINPADVVSIPSDYDFAKGRAWRYMIVGEHTLGELTEAFDTPVVTNCAEPVKSARKSAGDQVSQTPSTSVLGVDFGNETRARMVQALIHQNYTPAQGSRTADQGRVDGFDDAWDDRAPTLERYRGNHMRDAVEYARAYFEGYDRCRGKVDTTVQPAVVATPAPAAAPKANPSLMGYNQGRKDGARLTYNEKSSQFVGADQVKYETSYRKGYNSVR